MLEGFGLDVVKKSAEEIGPPYRTQLNLRWCM